MSNNFSGIQKNAESFQPKRSGGGDAGVGRSVGGLWPGQDPIVVFEKADQPVLDTTPTPRTDGLGESAIGLSGRVDHPDNDGGAKYLAGKIARVYRRIVADGADLETLSVEERRCKRDQLIQGVYDGDGQHSSGEAGSTSQTNTLAYITAVANVLFGLASEIPGTPEFLTRSESGFVHKLEGGVSSFVHKSASHVQVECPFCHAANQVESINTFGGLQKITCSSCAGNWQQDIAISTFTKDAPADLASLKKQLNEQVAILTERIRGIIARRSGVNTDTSGSTGSRFVNKTKGAGSDPHRLMKDAIANGTPADFKGQIVKSGFIPLDTGEQRNGEAKAREALGKALNNGVNIDQ